MTITRRTFAQQLATLTGGFVLLPAISACKSGPTLKAAAPPTRAVQPKRAARSERAVLPWEKPADWDPLAFNRKRGNAGAIPASYLSDINGPDGDTKHVGEVIHSMTCGLFMITSVNSTICGAFFVR